MALAPQLAAAKRPDLTPEGIAQAQRESAAARLEQAMHPKGDSPLAQLRRASQIALNRGGRTGHPAGSLEGVMARLDRERGGDPRWTRRREEVKYSLQADLPGVAARGLSPRAVLNRARRLAAATVENPDAVADAKARFARGPRLRAAAPAEVLDMERRRVEGAELDRRRNEASLPFESASLDEQLRRLAGALPQGVAAGSKPILRAAQRGLSNAIAPGSLQDPEYVKTLDDAAEHGSRALGAVSTLLVGGAGGAALGGAFAGSAVAGAQQGGAASLKEDLGGFVRSLNAAESGLSAPERIERAANAIALLGGAKHGGDWIGRAVADRTVYRSLLKAHPEAKGYDPAIKGLLMRASRELERQGGRRPLVASHAGDATSYDLARTNAAGLGFELGGEAPQGPDGSHVAAQLRDGTVVKHDAPADPVSRAFDDVSHEIHHHLEGEAGTEGLFAGLPDARKAGIVQAAKAAILRDVRGLYSRLGKGRAEGNRQAGHLQEYWTGEGEIGRWLVDAWFTKGPGWVRKHAPEFAARFEAAGIDRYADTVIGSHQAARGGLLTPGPRALPSPAPLALERGTVETAPVRGPAPDPVGESPSSRTPGPQPGPAKAEPPADFSLEPQPKRPFAEGHGVGAFALRAEDLARSLSRHLGEPEPEPAPSGSPEPPSADPLADFRLDPEPAAPEPAPVPEAEGSTPAADGRAEPAIDLSEEWPTGGAEPPSDAPAYGSEAHKAAEARKDALAKSFDGPEDPRLDPFADEYDDGVAWAVYHELFGEEPGVERGLLDGTSLRRLREEIEARQTADYHRSMANDAQTQAFDRADLQELAEATGVRFPAAKMKARRAAQKARRAELAKMSPADRARAKREDAMMAAQGGGGGSGDGWHRTWLDRETGKWKIDARAPVGMKRLEGVPADLARAIFAYALDRGKATKVQHFVNMNVWRIHRSRGNADSAPRRTIDEIMTGEFHADDILADGFDAWAKVEVPTTSVGEFVDNLLTRMDDADLARAAEVSGYTVEELRALADHHAKRRYKDDPFADEEGDAGGDHRPAEAGGAVPGEPAGPGQDPPRGAAPERAPGLRGLDAHGLAEHGAALRRRQQAGESSPELRAAAQAYQAEVHRRVGSEIEVGGRKVRVHPRLDPRETGKKILAEDFRLRDLEELAGAKGISAAERAKREGMVAAQREVIEILEGQASGRLGEESNASLADALKRAGRSAKASRRLMPKGPNGGDVDVSLMGRVRNAFVENLSGLKAVDPEAATAAARVGASRAQTGLLFRRAVPRIEAAGGGVVSWSDLRTFLVENRLRGVRDRWGAMSRDVAALPDQGFTGTWEHDYGDLAERLGVDGGVREAVEAGRVDQARDLLAQAFADAAGRVASAMPDAEFTAMWAKPELHAALDEYRRSFEAPIKENHAENEGNFSAALGPADTYFPLIALDEAGKPISRGNAERGLAFGKRANRSNHFATGLAEAYDVGAEGLAQKLEQAFRHNNQAALVRALEGSGLLRKVPAAQAVGGAAQPAVVRVGGREFEGRYVQVSKDRVVVKDGKTTVRPGEWAIVPEWLAQEVAPALEGGEWSPKGLLGRVVHAGNQFGMVGPLDAFFHGNNIVGAMVAGTPMLGKPGLLRPLGNLPFTKRVNAIAQIVATDPMSEASLRDLERMARVGALPEKYAAETVSPEFAQASGAELVGLKGRGAAKLKALGALLYGPAGIDVRARLVMYRAAREFLPNASDGQIRDFVNQLGAYNKVLEARMERAGKASGAAPFATAGKTMIQLGVRTWLMRSKIPLDAARSPAHGVALRAAQQLSGGAAGYVAVWALAHHAVTGKWPWEDRDAKLGKIPVPEAWRKTALGKRMFGDRPGTTAYVSLDFLNPIAGRGARAVGARAAFDAWTLGGDGAQIADAMAKDVVNSALHPLTSGPVTKAAFVGATGYDPYLVGERDTMGRPGIRLWRAAPEAGGGLKQRAVNAGYGLASVNSLLGDLGTTVGILPEAGLHDEDDGLLDGAIKLAFGVAAGSTSVFSAENRNARRVKVKIEQRDVLRNRLRDDAIRRARK